MVETIEEILRNDPHVIRVELPIYEIPNREELDPEKIDARWASSEDSWQYQNIKEFLGCSLTVDDFPPTIQGHDQRTTWKQLFIDGGRRDVYQFLQDNPLRLSFINPVIIILDSMRQYYVGQDRAHFEELIDNGVTYYEKEMENYGLEQVERKVEMVRELQKRACAVLDHLKKE